MGDLDAPAARVRALLEAVFGPVTAIGDSFVAQRRDCLDIGSCARRARALAQAHHREYLGRVLEPRCLAKALSPKFDRRSAS